VLYLLWWFRRGSEVMSAEAALHLVEAERGIEVKVVAGLQAEEVGDEIRVALDQLKTAAELLFPVGQVTRTPSPSRCGRLRYKPWRIMRMWAVPSIKLVFLKELSLNSSSHWS